MDTLVVTTPSDRPYTSPPQEPGGGFDESRLRVWAAEQLDHNHDQAFLISRLVDAGVDFDLAADIVWSARDLRDHLGKVRRREEARGQLVKEARRPAVPLAMGAALLAIGLMVWFVTYDTAPSRGGLYIIPIGTLAWGVVSIFIGVRYACLRRLARGRTAARIGPGL